MDFSVTDPMFQDPALSLEAPVTHLPPLTLQLKCMFCFYVIEVCACSLILLSNFYRLKIQAVGIALYGLKVTVFQEM